jgi:hypothetical protein
MSAIADGAKVRGCRSGTLPRLAIALSLVAVPAGCASPRPRVEPAGSGAVATAVVAPATRRAWEACKAANEPKARYASVREVDWCNQGYAPVVSTLRQGRGELHEYEQLGAPHDTYLARLDAVAYGDLDDDGRPEVALLIEERAEYASGASHAEHVVYVLRVRDGRVEPVARWSTEQPDPWLVIDGASIMVGYVAHGELCATPLALRAGELVASRAVCAPGQ